MIHAYAYRFVVVNGETRISGFDHAIHHTPEAEEAFFQEWKREQEQQGRKIVTTPREILNPAIDRFVSADADNERPAVYQSYTVA